jgi:hypothetical protein
MLMLRARILSIVLLSCFVLSATASGAFIPVMEPVTLESLIGNDLVIEDKIFADWEFQGSSGGGAMQPDEEFVLVQGGVDDATGDIGLRFVMPWLAGPSQFVDAVLGYSVTVAENSPLYIHDVAMYLTGVSATGTGQVAIGESVWSGPVPEGDPLVSLGVARVVGDGAEDLVAHEEFTPVKQVFVRKNAVLVGGEAGTAHVSEFFQFYSQIPEPTTTALLGVGVLALIRRHRRR